MTDDQITAVLQHARDLTEAAYPCHYQAPAAEQAKAEEMRLAALPAVIKLLADRGQDFASLVLA